VLACSADEPEIAAATSSTTPSSTESADETRDDVVIVAASTEDLHVWSSPQDSAREVETLSPDQQTSGQVVGVVAQELNDDWLEVVLPTAPAGHTGWVKRADVKLSRHRFRIEVSRSRHTLTLHAGEVEALATPVAIGTVDAPPVGANLFIKDLVEPPNPAGPYARYAYGLSGFPNDLAAFEAGAGVVAIHGAADPTTLGRDVPMGSIGVDPAIITRMVATIGLPLGTPVDIVE
jgi:hypothetical protein